MKRRHLGWAWLALLASQAGAAGLQSLQERAEARLDKSTVSAEGRQEATLLVSGFGRYSVTVKSPQGTALQLVDHMGGPGEVFGTPGEADGRLDAFLDRGSYKLVTHPADEAEGTATLEAHAYRELSTPAPPLLVELKNVSTTLGDFEQRSWWLQLEKRRTVTLEAAGRNLADLRLWKDGTWLIDAKPETELIEPKTGQPMLACRLAVDLEPGLYLLTSYGGPTQPWSVGDEEHPLHLRYGIPSLGSAGRRRFVLSPFGADRWLVPSQPNYYRLELPEARPASIQMGSHDPRLPFQREGDSAEIRKDSALPVAELFASPGNQGGILTISGEAGQPFLLQHFERKDYYPLPGDGQYWLSTVHSGHAADSVDATVLVTRYERGKPEQNTPFLAQALELSPFGVWARRFNLLERVTLFLYVKKAGTYGVLLEGTNAQFRIEPFLRTNPANYKAPALRTSGSGWELEAGYHVLTVEPVEKGVVSMAIYPPRMLSVAKAKLAQPEEMAKSPVLAAARFGEVTLDKSLGYWLYFNRQPEVRTGLILRQLPLDLSDPLPVAQKPGEAVSVPFRAAEAGMLRAEAEDGTLLEVSVDGGAWQQAATVAAGKHTAAVRNSGSETALYSLGFQALRLQAATPLPPLPESALSSMPKFSVLADGSPQFLDLAEGQSATFLVRADAPALYELQSTGLLATEGNLRTRTVTSLFRESQNGVGRNFLIQQYLREGTYQVTVTAQESLRGHLGLELKRTQLVDGGELSTGVPARIALPAGAAVAYRFTVGKAQVLRLQSIGLGRTFRCRLEDEGGWPVAEPNTEARFTRYLTPGKYRLILLPEAAASRRVTLLEQVLPPLRFEGHGPHALPLARQAEHLWVEPEAGAERVPDVWEFAVPAPVGTTVALGGEMEGRLLRLSDTGVWTAFAAVPAAKGWSGRLEAGRWRLEAVCKRINSKVAYSVEVRLGELLAGQSLDIEAPASVPLSVGKAGLVELASFGAADVRARLYDEGGRLLAESDDRPEDWNFHLLQRLGPGRYRLQIDPVGAASAACSVSMDNPREIEEAPLALPAKAEVVLGREVRLYPLELPAGTGMLLVSVRSFETVGCSLEVAADDGWRTLATSAGHAPRLEVPLDPAGSARYRLRLWSLDRRGTAVQLGAAAASPAVLGESALAQGVAFETVTGVEPAAGVLAVKLDRPGVFELDGAALRRSTAAGQSCEPGQSRLVAASGSMLWLVTDLPVDGSSVTARGWRLTLPSGTEMSASLQLPDAQPAVWDLAAPAQGPVLVLATSMVGQPAVRVVDRPDALAPQRSGRRMAVGPRSAVSVALRASEPAAVVWAAEASSEPTDVRLRQWSFPSPAPQSLAFGVQDGVLNGLQAASFDLPAGSRQLRLTLGRNIVAVLSEGDRVESVHWAGGEAFEETVDGAASRLTLLHSGGQEDRYAVLLLPLDAARQERALAAGASFERSMPQAGTLRLPVEVAEGKVRLQVRGAVREVLFVSAAGYVARGTDLDLRGPGTLLVRHDPGLVMCWMDRDAESGMSLWGLARPETKTEVSAPAVVPLGGSVTALRFSSARPVMLHLRGSTPVVTRVQRAEAKPEIEAQMKGLELDVYVPGGAVEIWMRGLGGAVLHGTAEVTATEVTPIGEGLGPEVLLSAGATRLYSFETKRKGPVGIGVQSDAGSIDCWLLDRSGKRLGSGVVQMPELEAGTYLVALHVPEDSAPVRARPAMAGLTPPDTGPPAEVIQNYLREARGEAAEPERATQEDTGQEPDAGEESETDEPATDEEGGAP